MGVEARAYLIEGEKMSHDDKARNKFNRPATRMIIRVIGIIFLFIGLAILAFGLKEGIFNAMFTVFIGSALLMFGAFLLVVSFLRPISKYVAGEYYPAMRTVGKGFGEGFTEASQNENKVVVKVKCSHCGYLETKDAEFCSKCGRRL